MADEGIRLRGILTLTGLEMRGFVAGVLLVFGLVPGATSWALAAGNASEGQAKTTVCAGCHNADGNSSVPNFPKLAGQGERYLVDQISDIKAGLREVVEMTGMTDGLSEQDIADISAFYASQMATTGQANPDTVALGESLFLGGNEAKGIPSCTGCHAPNGKGNAPAGFPLLAGQHATYIEGQLKKYRSGERAYDASSNMMRDIAANLSDAEIEALANYISGLY